MSEQEHWALPRLRELTEEWGDDCEGAIMHAWMRRHDALAAVLGQINEEVWHAIGRHHLPDQMNAMCDRIQKAISDALPTSKSPTGRQLDQENG